MGEQRDDLGDVHDDPAVAVLRAQALRHREFEAELRKLSRQLKISEKIVTTFMRSHMDVLWYGERGPQLHDFETFARSGESYGNPFSVKAVRMGPRTRQLLSAWLAQRAVQVAPDYETAMQQPRCPSCGQLYRRGAARRGALAS